MPSTAALIVAAGSGSRAGPGVPKQFRRIGGRAVLRRAYDALRSHPRIDEVRIVIGAGQEATYREAMAGCDPPEPVEGGAERACSVYRGLETVTAERVLIHDAARPFCPPAVIDRLLAALDTHRAAVPVLAIPDTVVRGDGILREIVDREGLFRVQTPQAFDTRAILQAFDGWRSTPPTDESQVARAAGIEVAMVAGDPALEKLTFESDFEAAEHRLAARLTSRTGLGFDVHAFAAGDGLWLGGVRIPHDRALRGHSDADVVLHAVTDALLGAIGEGDIGDHFPPSDPHWRGAASSRFVAHARALVEARGGRIDHVDVTLICEAPRIGPHRAAMRTRIAALLGIAETRVSVKATTTERLGFTGRGEGIAAQAVATVRLPEEG
ncbi:MAG TPA: bifunctional 2-C-methyl-D-erythritol 4-phosphate cytidylyltransferase/2-C-methyl-D-erythritol 2,4-cyclodiphosphate synthase [Allosphingosinicella sp.]|nr:bifunctional 2-C-methyl-D-erythritol 4-phosphate cytidylyltransferase/2-C-methyl-D-erythritol 2,4-cyclodiphosphate synthase [Allosphingosinicella sp.]